MTDDAEAWARRIDPEIRPVLDLVPASRPDRHRHGPPERAELAARAAAGHVPPPSVRTEDRRIPGWPDGEPEVVVRVHEPAERSASPRPALLWVHGGGHVLGQPHAQDDPLLQDLVARTGCVAVAVEWRRAPEDPYPAAVHDAYAALRWMAEDPALDPGRLVVGGASSGGGAAAGLALLARDRGEVRLAGQVLVYPMLDDREVTASSREVRDPRLWNHESNRLGWAAYLSGLDGGEVPRLRRARPGYRPPRAAVDLARDGRARPLPRRGHRVCVAACSPRECPPSCMCTPGPCTASTSSPRRPRVSRRYRRDRDEALRPVRRIGPAGSHRPPGNDSATGFREVLASALRSL